MRSQGNDRFDESMNIVSGKYFAANDGIDCKASGNEIFDDEGMQWRNIGWFVHDVVE